MQHRSKYKQSNPFYHTRAWRDVRAVRLQMDNYLCVDCVERFERGEPIKVRDAVLVHHMIPLEERPELGLTLANLRSLCDTCHNKRHPEKGDGSRKDSLPQAARGVRVIKV